MTGEEILAIPMEPNEAEAPTIRAYIVRLALEVFTKGECFSGKRPFGSSGWLGEVEAALIKAGAVKGKLDEDGYVEEVDCKQVTKSIKDACKALEQ